MTEIREQDYESVASFKNGIIHEFAIDRGQPFGFEQYAFEALNEGERVGVIMCEMIYDWLYVDYLAVTEAARGSGVGSRLMERVEALAMELGLSGVALDTFRYQAPDYYSARGYVERMVIPGKVHERDRIYMQKSLGGQ